MLSFSQYLIDQRARFIGTDNKTLDKDVVVLEYPDGTYSLASHRGNTWVEMRQAKAEEEESTLQKMKNSL